MADDKKPKEEPQAIPKQGIIEESKPPIIQEPRVAPQEKPPVIIKNVQAPEIRIFGEAIHHKLTRGQRAGDRITKLVGSWTFIILFICYIITWVSLNLYALMLRWDPFPFILLNLTLSCIAALQAPIILMSQNRAAERDRAKAERDYAVNRKSEKEVELIKKDLDHIKKQLAEIRLAIK